MTLFLDCILAGSYGDLVTNIVELRFHSSILGGQFVAKFVSSLLIITILFAFSDESFDHNSLNQESSIKSNHNCIQSSMLSTQRDCPGYIKGDNNLDSIVDILDIVLIVQCILMDSCMPLLSDCEAWAMDFDDDGILGVGDIIGMIEIIMG